MAAFFIFLCLLRLLALFGLLIILFLFGLFALGCLRVALGITCQHIRMEAVPSRGSSAQRTWRGRGHKFIICPVCRRRRNRRRRPASLRFTITVLMACFRRRGRWPWGRWVMIVISTARLPTPLVIQLEHLDGHLRHGSTQTDDDDIKATRLSFRAETPPKFLVNLRQQLLANDR